MMKKLQKITGGKALRAKREVFPKDYFLVSQNLPFLVGVALFHPNSDTLNIRVVTKSQSGCVVPNDTLLHKKDGLFVMAYINEKFKAKKVKERFFWLSCLFIGRW